MNLENILAISGKPGLFKMVSNTGRTVIVQSLLDNKRMPVQATHKVSALQDISIYTYDEDVPLSEVFDKIKEKAGDDAAISHKSSPEELRDYMGEVLPKFDEDRVYPSDLKKLFQWYNLLHEHGLLLPDEAEETNPEAKPEKVEAEAEAKDKGEEKAEE